MSLVVIGMVEQQEHTYGEQQVVYCLNIFKSTLDECKDVDPVDTFQIMFLVWDTGSPFELTPFKAEFVDCVECDIPVINVTNINKFIDRFPINLITNIKFSDMY